MQMLFCASNIVACHSLIYCHETDGAEHMYGATRMEPPPAEEMSARRQLRTQTSSPCTTSKRRLIIFSESLRPE